MGSAKPKGVLISIGQQFVAVINMKQVYSIQLFICLFCLSSFMPIRQARQNVIFELQFTDKALPGTNDSIFLAGDFNGWHTADTAFAFKKNRKGIYVLKTKLSPGQHAFKVVRGSWQTVETDREGQAINNRILDVEKLSGRGAIHLELKIAGWADHFASVPVKSTAASNVDILDTAFLMPELNRQRRIWIYLPKNYKQDTASDYPVLYMQDGQNVFDDATAFSGEWSVDEYLNSLPDSKQCIVIAVDNGGNERMLEYNPFNNKQFGKGEGKAYVSFLARTLKPFIDQHYRTKPEARFTAIAGSSMGGLISYYAAISYPGVFGRAGIFSPSFWIAPEIYDSTRTVLSKLNNTAFYFYGGGKEGDSLQGRLAQMTSLLKQNASIITTTDFNAEGMHEEKYWRASFKNFYGWLTELQARNP